MLGLVAVLALTLVPSSAPAANQPLIRGVMWMGDSIAYDLAPGVETALAQAGLRVSTFAFPGISLTGGDWLPEGETWLESRIPSAIDESGADVVVWQLSAYPLPVSHDAAVLAYTAFVDLALRTRTSVVFVTAPPVRQGTVPPALLERGSDALVVAEQVAAHATGRVFVVDSAPVWGSEYVELADDGTPLRKPDGVHICQLGATIFGDFLARWLDDHYAGVAPVDPSEWPLDWWFDGRYFMPLEVCVQR